MPNKSPRNFSREFKLEAVRRILAGEQHKGSFTRAEGAAQGSLCMARTVPGGRGGGAAAAGSTAQERWRCYGESEGAGARSCGRRRWRAGRSPSWSARSASRRWNWIFFGSLAAYRGVTPAEQRSWRDGVFAQIQAMTVRARRPAIERMCALAGVSRASFYRDWAAARRAGGDGCAT